MLSTTRRLTTRRGHGPGPGHLAIPFQQVRHFGVRHKVLEIDDAAGLVRSGDTLLVSGFVAQGAPEYLLKALGNRFLETGHPKDLTLMFGGGPGDWDSKGLNHLAHKGLLKRCIGAHYGQVPQIQKLVIGNEVEAYNLPLGAISRMTREACVPSPGFITKVGLGTFVDPRISGGKISERTEEDLVELLTIGGEEYLRFKPVSPQVSFIRATTGDQSGNLTLERESLLGDVRQIAMATRSSGGVVIAQVERLAATNSLNARDVAVSGAMVDAVVVAPQEDHAMSFFTNYNPVWSAEIREPMDMIVPLELNARKIIARRAALELKADDIVNLGIGMPEGIANVASEEDIFAHLTLTTEPGAIGGVGASGVEFGPASGAEAYQEMNQQFDFYNGGGLDKCFLGVAQCSSMGDVNVSRLSEDSLTGPGGFIDISQCTPEVYFLGTFTKKGLKVACENNAMVIQKEGKIKTFIEQVREITFSAKQAVLGGQRVLFITERAVFKLVAEGLQLIEVAPGVDMEKDILAHMDFKPIIVQEELKEMEARIFDARMMGMHDDMFSTTKIIKERMDYCEDSHTLFLDFSNYSVTNQDQIEGLYKALKEKFVEVTNNGTNKVHVVVDYDNFDCRAELVEAWTKQASDLEDEFYLTVNRFTSKLFMRQKLSKKLRMLDDDQMWDRMTGGGDILTAKMLRRSLLHDRHMNVNVQTLHDIMGQRHAVSKEEFREVMNRVHDLELNASGTEHTNPGK